MPRLRTVNNRRRARQIKPGGLFRFGTGWPRQIGPSWADEGASPAQIIADIRRVIGR